MSFKVASYSGDESVVPPTIHGDGGSPGIISNRQRHRDRLSTPLHGTELPPFGFHFQVIGGSLLQIGFRCDMDFQVHTLLVVTLKSERTGFSLSVVVE